MKRDLNASLTDALARKDKLLELKNKQLITAGEIIKAFMNFKPVVGNVVYYHEEYEKVYKQAESFLEEVEQ